MSNLAGVAAAVPPRRLLIRLRLRLLHAVSVTGVLPVLVRLPSAREGHRAETGATLMETNASPVAAAAGAAGRLRLRLLHAVSVTGVLPVLVRLPSAREGHRAETGATLMETDASLDAAAAGALETVKFRKREWCRVSFMDARILLRLTEEKNK
jgi:uncharacterized Zn-binding protein involved in type VI secretion